MLKRSMFLFALVAGLGCNEPGAEALTASADLAPLGMSGVEGTVTFTELDGGKVRVQAELTGLTPGLHGMHVHEWGDCGDNGMAAGGHFNPDVVDHGAPDAAVHHPGDFGNVEADAQGRASLTLETDAITLDNGMYGVLGRALIIHEKADDLMTQPTGDAGGRIACGLISDGASAPVLQPSS